VGNAVEQAFQPLVKQLNKVRGLTVELVALNSDYWGQEITVTGLLTGQDLLKGLQGKNLGDGVLLPSLMLKHGEAVFLDDLTLETVINQLGVPIYSVLGVEELIKTCLTLNPLNKSYS
jgi:NifB/MoaA-like Fe-S oxidoreductase